jgi:hypothetical protein
MRAAPSTLLSSRFPALPGVYPPRVPLRDLFEAVPILAQVGIMDMKAEAAAAAAAADARTIKSSDEDEQL